MPSSRKLHVFSRAPRIFRSTRDIELHASPRIDPRGAQDFPQ
jgi:hypothetical protein